MQLLYVPIIVGLFTLTADAMQPPNGDGGGRGWGRHHGGGGGHHGWKGGGHCRRGDAQGCANVTVTAKFDAGSVTPDVLKLESDYARPISHIQEDVVFPIEIRRHSPITPGMLITYTILKYAAGGQKN
jgi:hypothetical protein